MLHAYEVDQAAKTTNLAALPQQDVLVFTQTDDLHLFLLDTSSTHGDPIYPERGVNEKFYIAGFWAVPTYMDHVRFLCDVFGSTVYNVTFDEQQDMFGQWLSDGYVFIIPGSAPAW